MHTDGSSGEFLAQYPQVVKLWKQYFQNHKSKCVANMWKFDYAVTQVFIGYQIL